MLRRQVAARGQRHRRARGDLADDEPPPGDVAPERPEPVARVDVRASRLRVHRGKLGRGGGVAEGDDGGDQEPDQHARPGRGDRRAPCAEHARTDHGAGADGHRGGETEPAWQRGRHPRRLAGRLGPASDGRRACTDRAISGPQAGRARRRCRTDPPGGSACRRVLRRCRCGSRRRRRAAGRPRTARSSTMRWIRFQPPGPGVAPSGIGRPAELFGPASSSRRLPRLTSANAGAALVSGSKPSSVV